MKSMVLKAYLFLMMMVPCVALAEKPGTLHEWFSMVRHENGVLVVETKANGPELAGRIGEASENLVLAPGERAKLPEGELSFFHVERETVSFVPLRQGRGFMVRKIYDDRPKGGGWRAVEFELVIAENGALRFGTARSVTENGPKVY